MRWALVEAIQHVPAGHPLRQRKDDILARRGDQAKNIAKTAAARQLLTWVFYAMRDGQVRALAPAAGGRPPGLIDPAARTRTRPMPPRPPAAGTPEGMNAAGACPARLRTGPATPHTPMAVPGLDPA